MTATSVDNGRLRERLGRGPVICAEGYLFELERRGYVQAGPFVPEAVLDHPEVVAQLHRDFVHAGSDVVPAFTYYAHREKMRLVGKEDLLEELNRQALAIAKDVAAETDALVAGDICNTNVFAEDDASQSAARAMFEEQVGWAVEAEVDFVIGEAVSCHVAALPVPYRTHKHEPTFQSLRDPEFKGLPGEMPFPTALDPFTCNRYEIAEFARAAQQAGVSYLGLCCGGAPHLVRSLAEALGRTPPASRYSADMSKHAFFGTDESLKKENLAFAEEL